MCSDVVRLGGARKAGCKHGCPVFRVQPWGRQQSSRCKSTATESQLRQWAAKEEQADRQIDGQPKLPGRSCHYDRLVTRVQYGGSPIQFGAGVGLHG